MIENNEHNIGSSETTRESPSLTFDFTNYLEYHRPEHKRNEDISITIPFLQWFVGFTEGDGTFTCESEGKKNKMRLLFSIGQKDAKLIFKVKKRLGFGYVRRDREYFYFCVDNRKGIQCLQALFNGNLVLPKRVAQFVSWVNYKPEIQHPTFRLISKPILPSLEDAWISGFIEAEGCFYANLNTEKKLFTIKSHKVTITQKDTHGEKAILEHIKQLFKAKTQTYLVKPPDCFRIVIEALTCQIIMVEYLQRFCLLGKKRIAAFRWWRIHHMKLNKSHLESVNQNKLQRLCQSINQQAKDQEEKEGIAS